jgi:hypothetical protein
METKTSLNHETPPAAKPLLSAGLSPLRGKWIVGNVKGGVQTETIHFQRKGAIAKFLEGSSMTWDECVKCGWIVCKVDIVFQPCR